MSASFWVCGIVSAISAYVSLGFAIAGWRVAKPDARTGYLYALARSVALAVIATAAFFTESVAFASCVAVALVATQLLDGIVGVRIRDRVKTIGPLITAVVNAAALAWLLASHG